MKSIIMTNDFHSTSVTLRPDSQGRLTEAQVRKARRTLCGMDGCTCGDSFGMRGDQPDESRNVGISMLYSAAEQRGGYAARVYVGR